MLINRNDKGKINQKIIGICFLACILNPLINSLPVTIPSITYDRTVILNQPILEDENQDIKADHLLNKKDASKSSEKEPSYFSLNEYLAFIWLLGFIIQVFFAYRELKVLLRIVKDGEEINIMGCELKIIASSTATSPFLFSFIKSYIILPQNLLKWKKSHIDNVILHEICHYKRRDHWYLWLSLITSTLFWFHPIIKYLTRKQKVLIENGCDIHLIKQGINPIEYAETIIKSARCYSQSSNICASMSSNKNQLQDRIKVILSTHQLTPLKNKTIFLSSISCLLFLTGCINFQQINWVSSTQLIEFISHDLPVFRKGNIHKGDIHISAFYDGQYNPYTNIRLEIKDNNKRAAWLDLGPLEKFNKHIHTWHFKLKEGAYVTGKYTTKGAIPDGVVDGIALGLITTDENGNISILKSKEPLKQGMQPNFICAWPLGINENDFIRALPQLTTNNPDSVERILCGAQLVSNGEHWLN